MGKRIIFCLPGSHFSREFVQALCNTVSALSLDGHQIQLAFGYDANVFYARSRVLLCETLKGVDQKPFGGKIDYDYLMWIDSDVIFTVDSVRRLLSHDKDVVSGCYVMHNNTHYPIVETMDHDFFLKKGHYDFWSRDVLKEKQALGKLIPVAYVGFGFMLIKKGVFESLQYPFFSPKRIDFDTENVVEYASEDVSWCMDVRARGYEVLIDPHVIVAHQKLIPLA